MIRKFWLVLALFSAMACNKQEAAPPDAAEAPSAAATPPAARPVAAATPPALDLDSLSVEEEFEADAEKELTSANLTAKLDELEKQISAP